MKPPQKPELIRSALTKHRGKGLRSEDLIEYTGTDYDTLFVDPNVIENLTNNTTQVIYGRTGSGKTHLLQALKERICRRLEEERAFAFFLSAPTFRESPEGIYRWSTPQEEAGAYFRRFVSLLARQFSDRAQNILYKDFGPWKFAKRSKKRDELELRVLELEELLEKGSFYYPPAPTLRTEEQTSSQKRACARDSGAAASVSVRPRAALADAEFRAGAAIAAQHEMLGHDRATTVRETLGIPVSSFHVIRDLMLKILEILDLRYISVLIDEWPMGLDTTGATPIQAEFGEMLKRSFLRTGKIAFKISTNWYQTSFTTETAKGDYRGLIPGTDIFDGAHLDHALLGEKELEEFYEELLFRRLRQFEQGLHFFDRARDNNKPAETFIDSIFQNRRVFKRMVSAAEGIPRHFLELFNSAAGIIECDVKKQRIGQEHVDASITTKGSQLFGEVKKTDSTRLLEDGIKRIVNECGARLFFIRKDAARLRRAIDDLLNKKIIHHVATYDMPQPYRQTLDAYRLDYTVCLDWQRAVEFRRGSADALFGPLPKLKEGDDIGKYTISEDMVKITDV